MTYVVIHGHFYQPPRENPWTDILDREPSAAPFHDWNERINGECYQPNAVARVMDGFGRVEHIVNNYESINFNFGPTLLLWLEAHDPDTYARILAADKVSVAAHGGHGNAIAQAYNHAILPLCNDRDRRTQIRWGLADFKHRFGRDAEALWLAETACNDATMDALIDQGLKYVILSPHQAERVRKLGSDGWRSVADGSIDPGVAYRCFHKDGSGRSIAAFFYDGPISRAIGFEGVLTSSHALVGRLRQTQGGPNRLVHVATDGESYGHHTRMGERCLAYAMLVEAPKHGLIPTNYGHFLEMFPPELEVEIKPGPQGEGTAWSCAHGVGRWYRDCGCQTGGQPGWNQEWRAPLREALDHLRDHAATAFEKEAGKVFADPYAVRDAYIEVLLAPEQRHAWLERQAGRALSGQERVRALTLLEMQRHTQLMYTSCGWFFTELSGIETVQVLKYAGRVMDYLDELGLDVPRDGFLYRLTQARSNLEEMGSGADIYRRFVEPLRTTVTHVAAGLAMGTLVEDGNGGSEEAGYRYQRSLFRKEKRGRVTMATGRLQLENLRTGMTQDYARASLHLGGVDFFCALRPFPGEEAYGGLVEKIWAAAQTASLPTLLRQALDLFGPMEFGLENVPAYSRERVARLIHGDVVDELAQDFGRTFAQYERIIEMLEEVGLELPEELAKVAEFSIGRRLLQEARNAHQNRSKVAIDQLLTYGTNLIKHGHHPPEGGGAARLVADLVVDCVRDALVEGDVDATATAVALLGV